MFLFFVFCDYLTCDILYSLLRRNIRNTVIPWEKILRFTVYGLCFLIHLIHDSEFRTLLVNHEVSSNSRVNFFILLGFTAEAEAYCEEKGIACSEDERWLETGKLKPPLV